MDFSKDSSSTSSPSSTISTVDEFLLNNNSSHAFDDYSEEAGPFSFILDHQVHQPQQVHQLESDFGVNIEEFLSL